MTETGRGHMTEAHGSGKKGMRWLPFLLVLSLCTALLGCQVEVYRGLTEAQVNTMLSTLLKRGIRAEKTAAGKAGFTLWMRISSFSPLKYSKRTTSLGRTTKTSAKFFPGRG